MSCFTLSNGIIIWQWHFEWKCIYLINNHNDCGLELHFKPFTIWAVYPFIYLSNLLILLLCINIKWLTVVILLLVEVMWMVQVAYTKSKFITIRLANMLSQLYFMFDMAAMPAMPAMPCYSIFLIFLSLIPFTWMLKRNVAQNYCACKLW